LLILKGRKGVIVLVEMFHLNNSNVLFFYDKKGYCVIFVCFVSYNKELCDVKGFREILIGRNNSSITRATYLR